MTNILLLVFSIIDILGAIGVLFSSNLILSAIAFYIGIALLIKGVWSFIMGVVG
jgi:hypothetical protein